MGLKSDSFHKQLLPVMAMDVAEGLSMAGEVAESIILRAVVNFDNLTYNIINV